MKRIGNLIDKEFISPSFWRWLEIFIFGAIVSLLVGLLDNVEMIINGWTVDWGLFFSSFATTTATAIISALRKHLSDVKASLDTK